MTSNIEQSAWSSCHENPPHTGVDDDKANLLIPDFLKTTKSSKLQNKSMFEEPVAGRISPATMMMIDAGCQANPCRPISIPANNNNNHYFDNRNSISDSNCKRTINDLNSEDREAVWCDDCQSVLSKSLQDEHRFMKELGWIENNLDDPFYAPLTEQEVNEFKIRTRYGQKIVS